jgi:glycosyltransferase involved in cell wall biosynthesis
MAAALLRHRGTMDLIDRFIALSPVISESLLAAGVDGPRIRLKANSVPDLGRPKPIGEGVAFIGRLSEEKGVLDLLAAWQEQPTGSLGPLRIAGDGPLLPAVRRAAALRPDIRPVGRLDRGGVRRLLDASAAVVVPSKSAEAFGLVLIEAMAAGRALLVSDRGALPLIVGPAMGKVVSPDVAGLARGLVDILHDRERLTSMGAAARREYESSYNPDVATARLIEIYDEVLASRQAAL